MKSFMFTLVITLAAAAFANCEPNKIAGESSETKTIIVGSEVSGSAATKELTNSKPSTRRDLLGRTMYSESNTTGSEIQSIEITKDDVYSNARVDRYCSKSNEKNNAKCVSLCVKWTTYSSRQ